MNKLFYKKVLNGSMREVDGLSIQSSILF